jgi:hypothetical protein
VRFPSPDPPTFPVTHPDAVDRVLRGNYENGTAGGAVTYRAVGHGCAAAR